MSRTFTKLFSSITESTIWCEPDRTRLVWICMLAMADQYGRVWASVPGLANRARVPLEDAQKALDAFLSPDPYSRTPDFEGRRIEPIDGGWRLLNHEKYRAIRDEESIKESKRKYINARRAAERGGVENSRTLSNSVDAGRANAEADTEAEAVNTEEKKKAPRKREAPFVVPDWINREHWDAWHSCGKRKNCTNAQKQMAVDKLDSWRQQGIDHAAALENAAIGGWQGLFKPDQPGKAGGGGEHKYAAAHKAIFGDFQ